MVGLAGVLERRADPDRQRPIGANDPAVDRGPQQLALPGASPSSRGPVADVQRGPQRTSSSPGDRRLLGGRVAKPRRRPAEPSCRPRTRLGISPRSSARPLGIGASEVRPSRSHRGEGNGLRCEATSPRPSTHRGPRQPVNSGPVTGLVRRSRLRPSHSGRPPLVALPNSDAYGATAVGTDCGSTVFSNLPIATA